MAFLGVDIGSVSVKAAWVDADGTVLSHTYRRHYGRPLEAARQLLAEELPRYPALENIAFTGAGAKPVAGLLDAPFENEVVAQARAAGHLTPHCRTLIVVGGEDSFLILLDEGEGEAVRIRDFAMNGLCAAGCGSFLDQQASRLGLEIEGEFGALALAAEKPARIAGRCSVFAKTDMIHLQQKATPVRDMVAGLCYAFARNFVGVVARGKEILPAVVFHGGVASNAGMVRAFREVLELAPEDFLVPEHAATAGAVGAALLARKTGRRSAPVDLAPLDAFMQGARVEGKSHPPLPHPGPPPGSQVFTVPKGQVVDAYLGVDVGSISTNVVVIDEAKRVLAKSYLMTAGRPIEAVKQGLSEVGALLADAVTIRGVCTTGSGRYLIGDIIGADLVKNEITAQARAAAEIDPTVDTIFEIGGQDSKYIRLEHGAIVDFEMNKVCAAGTGSFLEEQAERLGVSIKGEFAAEAFTAKAPVCLGERCTVFMETDLVHQQSRGATTADLAAGLAYSIVQNYLNRVVAERPVGNHIFFQGGTAFNRAVVAAFQQVTGKPITVPEHHEVTGAIGCALMAREQAQSGAPSNFKGWDLSRRQYTQDSFECKGCANACEINRVRVEGEETLYYGGRCEKYEKKRTDRARFPDLFAEREQLLLAEYRERPAVAGKPVIGIPRALHFTDYLPFWLAFFNTLDMPVRLSKPTTKKTITTGVEATLAEFCFPVKVAHGHAQDLLDTEVTHLFLPCVVQLPKPQPGYKESVHCPYVQSIPYTLRTALMPEEHGVQVLAPVVDMEDRSAKSVKRFYGYLKELGVSLKQVRHALDAAYAAQQAFNDALVRRGRQVLDSLPPDGRAVVIISRPYNGCDNGVNLELPARFRDLGILPIPVSMLPVDEVDLSPEFPDLTWRYGQKILGAADVIRTDARLAAVYLTNFGCGPDSFLLKFFRTRMGNKAFLQLEIDEHSSDVGALTRCEAFLDSLRMLDRPALEARTFRGNVYTASDRVVYIPNMCDEAYMLAAAFRSVGISAEVLPESDAETVAVGRKFCTGKECFPCIVTTGDLARHLQRPEIDPRQAAFFMPTVGGGCRFGYYNVLQRLVLDELGYDEVPIFAPNQSRGFYETIGARASEQLVNRTWEGMVAIDLLQKALHYVRPRELAPGTTDRLYEDYLRRLEQRIEAGKDLQPIMREAREAFAAVPVSPLEHRPWIGMVGEVFVRLHRFSNQQVIRRLEELGAYVWLAPLTEWLFYVNLVLKEDAQFAGRWGEYLKVNLVDHLMGQVEHHLSAPWQGFLPNVHEASAAETVGYGARYLDPAFRGEAVMSLGKAGMFHQAGLDGIVNVMPFTCMPGTITGGMFKRFQQEHDRIPVLNLAYDGQEGGHLPIRLEAFVQQCLSYQERKTVTR